MKKLNVIFGIFVLFLITGCGHNIYTSTKGIGLDASWNGDSYIPSVRFGLFQASTFIPRGNITMSVTNATGGVLGDGGTSQTIVIKAGVQLNEANIVQICNNPTTADSVKLAAVQNVTTAKVPDETPTAVKITSASAATGPDAKSIQVSKSEPALNLNSITNSKK